MELDLYRFGINYRLKPTKASLEGIQFHHMSSATYDKAANTIMVGLRKYTVLKKLGSGTYGTALLVKDPSGTEFAIKQIHGGVLSQSEFTQFIQEVLIQIFLAEGSKDEPNGPYAPRVYYVGYDFTNKHAYIVCEMMRNTMHNLCSAFTPVQNDIVIPDALNQIAKILKYFGTKYEFNHRDLKPDNIMYKKVGEQRHFVLIDFGFSCMKWNGLQLRGNNYFSESRTCFKRERDLAQLSYACMNFLPISSSLKTWLHDVLKTDIGTHRCTLGNDCKVKGKKLLDGWRSTYKFLNRSNVHPLFTQPNKFTKKISKFQMKQSFRSPSDPVDICPPGKILGPDGSCIAAPAAIAPLVAAKPCPPGKVVNPKTGRCIKTRKATVEKKACPPGKVRNPETGRCVTKKATPPKPLAPVAALPPPVAALPPPPPPAKPVANPACPPDKVYNPSTKRCVKADGWAGKHLAMGNYDAVMAKLHDKK